MALDGRRQPLGQRLDTLIVQFEQLALKVDVLRGAVDEVCKYTPQDADVDLLRRSLQKFYANLVDGS